MFIIEHLIMKNYHLSYICRGDQIFNLELVDIDEVNLNAILLIGEQCLNLQKLCLHGCHFQIQPEDVGTVDSLCRAKSVCGEPGNNFCL